MLSPVCRKGPQKEIPFGYSGARQADHATVPQHDGGERPAAQLSASDTRNPWSGGRTCGLPDHKNRLHSLVEFVKLPQQFVVLAFQLHQQLQFLSVVFHEIPGTQGFGRRHSYPIGNRRLQR